MSLKVITLPLGLLSTNCYLVIDQDTSEAVIVDPADAGEFIASKCQVEGIEPKLILATHGHFDHILSATEIKLAFKVPFFINKKDNFLVENMQKSAEFFLGRNIVDPPPHIDGNLVEGDKIKIGNTQLTVLEAPGHTPGSICLYGEKENSLFVGDCIFAGGGAGRTDFSYSNYDNLVWSISKIFKLPSTTIIYPGHGPFSTLKEERKYHRSLIF